MMETTIEKLARHLDVGYSEALNIVLQNGEANALLIFHDCDNFTKPVGEIDFGIGFPNVPWHCPLCGEKELDPAILRYDIRVKIRKEIWISKAIQKRSDPAIQ